ncbi:hypothetical protein S911_19810 [Salmonella enterica subsp. enterica serovar Rubislaw]|nr:hypothetical protein [Salmonella enterica subsp. enterica serovar Rubislaw]
MTGKSFCWLGKHSNELWLFVFVILLCDITLLRLAHAEANIYSSLSLDKEQSYTGYLDNNLSVPFSFSGSTGSVADTYFVSPNCVSNKAFPSDGWLVYPEYVDDINNNIRLTVKLDGGDSVVAPGYRGGVVGQFPSGYYQCQLGNHYTGVIVGSYNINFNIQVRPIDSSKPVPRDWKSGVPLWFTDTFNREGPSIGWGRLVTKQKQTGTAIINFKQIDFCNTEIVPDVFIHEIPPVPGKYYSITSKLSSFCNGAHKLRYRLMNTGIGDNNNSISVGPGLESNLQINDKNIPANGISVDINEGTAVTLPVRSELTVSNGVSPGYYSNSTVLMVEIE